MLSDALQLLPLTLVAATAFSAAASNLLRHNGLSLNCKLASLLGIQQVSLSASYLNNNSSNNDNALHANESASR